MNDDEIKNKFNNLREKYGELLIKLNRKKISHNDIQKHLFKEFNEEEISFLFGQNIWKFTNKKEIDLDKTIHIDGYEIKNLNKLKEDISKRKALTTIASR